MGNSVKPKCVILHKCNSTLLNTVNTAGIAGGAGNIQVSANGEIYLSTGQGIVRVNSSGTFISSYTASNTNGLLTGAPKEFHFDGEGNIWVLYGGRLLKIPINTPANAKNYSYTADLNNISSFDVLNVTNSDKDILLAKTTGNAAIQIK